MNDVAPTRPGEIAALDAFCRAVTEGGPALLAIVDLEHRDPLNVGNVLAALDLRREELSRPRPGPLLDLADAALVASASRDAWRACADRARALP